MEQEIFEVTQSEMAEYKTCQYKWYLNYMKLLTPKKPSPALEDGTIFHESLDKLYSGVDMKTIGQDITSDYRKLIKESKLPITADDIERYEKRRMIMQAMVFSYAEHYASDKVDWNVTHTEEEFAIKYDRDGIAFIMRGKRDGRLLKTDDDSGKNYILEHKSTAMLKATYISQLEMSLQMQVYLLADWKVQKEDRAEALIINAALKSKLRQGKKESSQDYLNRVIEAYKTDPEKHFFREELRIPLKTLKKIEQDVIKLVRHMQRSEANPEEEVYRDEGACYKYGPCAFLPICKSRSLKGPHMNAYYTRDKKHQELQKEVTDVQPE